MAVDPRALLLAQLAGGGAPPDAPPDLPPGVGPGGLLGPGQGPEPGAPDAGPPPPNMPTDDPLQALQMAIQDIHALIGILPAPEHTRVAAQCLTALTGIQRDLMREQAPGGGPGGGGPSSGGGPPPGY